MARLNQLDDDFSSRVAQARDEGKVLRYVGVIEEDGTCRVKIAAVDGNDPLYKVKNGENALAFYSHYYQPLPLVLRGYGAGNDVTAAGVFADLLRTLSWKLRFKMVKVYAPASIGNVSVGFDVLGAAVTPRAASCWAIA